MYSPKGMTRDEMTAARKQSMAEVTAAFNEIKQANPDLGPYEIYVKVGEKLDKHPMVVLKLVKESSVDSKHAYTPFAMRAFREDGKKYTPSYVVCEELGVSNNTLREWVRRGIGPQTHPVFDAQRSKVVLAYLLDEVRAWKKSMAPIKREDGRKQYYDSKGKPYLPQPKANGGGVVDTKVTERKFPDFDAYQSVLGKKAREEFEGTYREALKLPESPAMAHAIAQAERDMQEALKKQDERKEQKRAARKIKPVKVAKKAPKVKVTKPDVQPVMRDSYLNNLVDESYADSDGKVRTIEHAVGYLKIQRNAFFAILYGYAVGYQYGVKGGGIPHTHEQDPGGLYNNRHVLTFKASDLKRWKRDEWKGYPHPVVKAKETVIPTRLQRDAPRRPYGKSKDLPIEEKRRIWREDAQRRRDEKVGKAHMRVRKQRRKLAAEPGPSYTNPDIDQTQESQSHRQIREVQERLERMSQSLNWEQERRARAEDELVKARLREQQAPRGGMVDRIRRIIFG